VQTFNADLAIVGAGGAGLRAAIAAAEANPQLKIALISKVYPMRSHTVAAEGGSAALLRLTTLLITTSTIPLPVVTGFANRMWSIISSIIALAKWLNLSNGVALGAVNQMAPSTCVVSAA
jgi:aspartate oxidase